MCECDAPSVHHETFLRARKEHTCCECGVTVRKGDVHQFIQGVWDGQWSRYRSCIECAQVRDWVYDQLTRWDECPSYSLLFDDWPHDELPAHVSQQRDIRRAQREARLNGGAA